MLDMRDLTAQDLQGLSVEQAQVVVEHIRRQAREIALKEARLEKLNFELARLKGWKFSAKTEAMNAQQRQMFEDTLAEDEADLRAQLQALRAAAPETKPREPRRQPRRQALPEQLRRVEHRHEPEDTICPTPGCGQPMTRVGEDVSGGSISSRPSSSCTATSTASGRAAAALGWCRSRPSRRSSTAACPPRGWWRTR